MEGRDARIKRRTFLQAGLAATAAGYALSCAKSGSGAWRFFTAAEAQTVDAISAQLIPADRDAGAKEAGVVNYIDIQLTRHFKKHQRAYRQGIAAIDAASRCQVRQAFAELPPEAAGGSAERAEENSRLLRL